MGSIVHTLRVGLEACMGALAGLPLWAGLLIASLVSGVLMAWVIGRLGRPDAMNHARDQMAAAVYEIRLFLDSPRRVVSSQGRLIWWNMRYLWTWVPALAVLTPPLGLLFLHMEGHWGVEALPTEQNLIVTARAADGVDLTTIKVESSKGAEITAPPVRMPAESALKVRVRLTAPGDHALTFTREGAEPVAKSLVGPEGGVARPERASGWALWWTIGDEAPLPSESGLVSISVPHEGRDVTLGGLPMPWWGWWLLLSTLTVVALKKPFKVSF